MMQVKLMKKATPPHLDLAFMTVGLGQVVLMVLVDGLIAKEIPPIPISTQKI